MKYKIWVAVIVAILVYLYLRSVPYVMAYQAPPPLVKVEEPSLESLIERYTGLYGAKYEEVYKVAMCESSLNPRAVGDGGKARNVAQFHEETFNRWSKTLGEDLNYNSAHDQIKLMSWAFSKGTEYKRAWTCSKITHII